MIAEVAGLPLVRPLTLMSYGPGWQISPPKAPLCHPLGSELLSAEARGWAEVLEAVPGVHKTLDLLLSSIQIVTPLLQRKKPDRPGWAVICRHGREAPEWEAGPPWLWAVQAAIPVRKLGIFVSGGRGLESYRRGCRAAHLGFYDGLGVGGLLPWHGLGRRLRVGIL